MRRLAIFLILAAQLVASDYSYTHIQIKEMASSYRDIVNNKLNLAPSNTSLFLQANEFRGYIASTLDSSIDFKACRERLTLNQVTYRTAVVISSSKINTSAIVPINVLVAIQIVCKSTK